MDSSVRTMNPLCTDLSFEESQPVKASDPQPQRVKQFFWICSPEDEDSKFYASKWFGENYKTYQEASSWKKFFEEVFQEKFEVSLEEI